MGSTSGHAHVRTDRPHKVLGKRARQRETSDLMCHEIMTDDDVADGGGLESFTLPPSLSQCVCDRAEMLLRADAPHGVGDVMKTPPLSEMFD